MRGVVRFASGVGVALALIGATAAQATPTPVQVTVILTFNDAGYPAVGTEMVLDFLFDSDTPDEDPAPGSYLATNHGTVDGGLAISGSVHELRALEPLGLWAVSGTVDVAAVSDVPFLLAITGPGLTPDQILPDFTSLTGGVLKVDFTGAYGWHGTRVIADVVAIDTIPEPFTDVDVDIQPGSCPNSWNRKGNGVLPVAILGTEDFDVTHTRPALRVRGRWHPI